MVVFLGGFFVLGRNCISVPCCCLTNICESWCPLAESASATTMTYDDVNYTSGGAQSTQRPLAFPVAHLSTMLGWEHVTACVAVSLR